MNYCLPQQQAIEFRRALRNGTIDPVAMSGMTSEQRRDLLTTIIGKENAKDVNALFESKLLLKNQQLGMQNWAQTVLGMRPSAKRDLISRIGRMDKFLTASNTNTFLNDLAEQKLGLGVTFNEAQEIMRLSANVETTKAAMATGGDRMDWGFAQVELLNYVDELKLKANKLTLKEFIKNPIGKTLTFVAGTAKSIQASMDNSAVFRQGWRTMWSHPKIWAKNAVKTLRYLTTYRNQGIVLDTINADILSRPTIDMMRKAKLDVGVDEEAYPTSLPAKIPLLGRIYKASENAYTGFLRRTRADVFDKYIEIAEKTGVELDDNELRSIGKMVNSLTGRGDLGSFEQAGKTLNVFFFSPKFFKSHIDVLTQPITGAGGSSFVRKQAAINLLKMVSGTATLLGIASLLASMFDYPEPVELDPRSADFGKIKIRNTRFDMTGGMGSLVILAARLLTSSSKSSVTDKITVLNETDKKGELKFGAKTSVDVIEDFTENKLSPAAQVVRDILLGQTRTGEKPTIMNETLNLVTPIPVKTGFELYKDPNAAPFLISMIADVLGISTNTYGGSKAIERQLEDAKKRGDTKEVERLKKALIETIKIEKEKRETKKPTETPAQKAERKQQEKERQEYLKAHPEIQQQIEDAKKKVEEAKKNLKKP